MRKTRKTLVIPEAFEEAWLSMKFALATGERASLLREQIALIIVEIATDGERNRAALCNQALRRIPPATSYYSRL
jgi:hypothetical protein